MTDTPSPEYVVPVVAQRLFGQSYPGSITIDEGFPDDDRFPRQDRGPGFVIRGTFGTGGPPVMDRSRGTTRTWSEIEAMFTPNSSSDFSDGSTVNDLWESTGIRFELVDRIDTPISSGMADFLPRDARVRRPVIDPLLRPGGVNLLMVKEIQGVLGYAGQYHPNDPDEISKVVISDMHRWATSDPLHHWRSTLIVLAHELGHVLGLGHVAFVENVMYGRGTKINSVQLTPPQIATCRYRAAYLSGAVPLPTRSPSP